jgi:NAD(P)-dependent dehydrogenase (short-subunit alcohol dehydrogenase family)
MGTGRLGGRTAIMTGSGQNIGRGIAMIFAAEGASVIVNGHRSRENVDSVIAQISSASGKRKHRLL